MRQNMTKTEFVTRVAHFHELLLSGQYDVQDFEPFSEDVLMVQYKHGDGFQENNPTTNVVLAA